MSPHAEAEVTRPSIEDEWYEQDSGGGDGSAKGADSTPVQAATSLPRPSSPDPHTEPRTDPREVVERHLVPYYGPLGEPDPDTHMRRCIACGRTSKIVPVTDSAAVAHEPDCAVLAALNDLILRRASTGADAPPPLDEATVTAATEALVITFERYCRQQFGYRPTEDEFRLMLRQATILARLRAEQEGEGR